LDIKGYYNKLVTTDIGLNKINEQSASQSDINSILKKRNGFFNK